MDSSEVLLRGVLMCPGEAGPLEVTQAKALDSAPIGSLPPGHVLKLLWLDTVAVADPPGGGGGDGLLSPDEIAAVNKRAALASVFSDTGGAVGGSAVAVGGSAVVGGGAEPTIDVADGGPAPPCPPTVEAPPSPPAGRTPPADGSPGWLDWENEHPPPASAAPSPTVAKRRAEQPPAPRPPPRIVLRACILLEASGADSWREVCRHPTPIGTPRTQTVHGPCTQTVHGPCTQSHR